MSHDLLLGKPVLYKDQYDPSLLFPVPRAQNRALLPLANGELPFSGVDIWNGWEISWLNSKGKPVVAQGKFFFAFSSASIIESKSFKLYLNSFNGTRFSGIEDVKARMQNDLSKACGAPVLVVLNDIAEQGLRPMWQATGINLDALDIDCDAYQLQPQILRNAGNEMVSEELYSQLLKSNCPVTGQPDWATVLLRYTGPAIDHELLLRYIVSYRNHAEFHEHCVERIFCDLLQHCHCQQLTVYARYTRRGGLDINPWRSNFEAQPDLTYCARQ